MKIPNQSKVKLGVVSTSWGFFPLTPDPYSGFPGKPTTVTGVQRLLRLTGANPEIVQFPVFGDMTDGSRAGEVAALIQGYRDLGLTIIPVIMFNNDPHGDDAEQQAYVRTLANGFAWAGRNGLSQVSATAFEKWMSGQPRIADADLPEANKRLARLILQAKTEAAGQGPIPDCVHLEYLRPNSSGGPGEFSSYTSLARAVPAILTINEVIGGDAPFARLLDDSAHAQDSLLSLKEQGRFIEAARDAGVLGISHASAPTTRGCLLSSADWLAAWIEHRSRLDALEVLLTEVFHPADQLLNPLRSPQIGFGEDTFGGRSVDQVVADGLDFVQRMLNAQVLLGQLTAAA